MDPLQRNLIQGYLPKLCKLTIVDRHFLTVLNSRNVISHEDVEMLESPANRFEVARLLYEILSTRIGGFEVLLQALSETKQTGALEILSQSKDDQPKSKDDQPKSKEGQPKSKEDQPKSRDDQPKSRDDQSQSKNDQPHSGSTKLFCKGIVNLDSIMTWASVIFINTVDPLLTISKLDETLQKEVSYFKSNEVETWEDIINQLPVPRLFGENNPNEIWAFHLHRNLDCSTINVKTLVERANSKKILLVSENDLANFNKTNQVGVLRDTFTWDQLTQSAQTRVLSQNILDQGKPRKLSEFCKSYVYENVDLFFSEVLRGTLLAALLKEEIPVLFRSTIPLVRHYVHRCLRSRYYISTNIFHTNSDREVFAFSGENLDIDKLREIGSGSTGRIDSAANQIDRVNITAEYILLEFKTDFSKLCNKLKGKKTVHRLMVKKEGLVWQETVGDNMSCLQSNILDEKQQVQITEEKFLDITSNYESMPRILCDSAGMGKSVLLAKLAQAQATSKIYAEKSIVIFFVMTDFIVAVQKALKNSDHAENMSTRNLTEIIQREIATYACMYQIPESIFNDRSISLHLFFDGLDEIPTETVSFALSCFKTIRSFFKNAYLYVTTRPELLFELEAALSSLAVNIDPFNEDNQIQFLTAHWSYDRTVQKLPVNMNMLRELAANCLDTLRSGLSKDDKDIAGVPLQCLLIAEVLKMEADEFADPANTKESKDAKPSFKITSIYQLYELVFERKFEVFKSRYLEKDNRPLKIPCLEAVHLQIGIETIFPEVDWINTLIPKLYTTSVYSDLKTMIPHWQATFNQFQSGDLPQRDILRVGIVESVGDGKWQFVHRTLGEYLVAMFASRQIIANDTCDQDMLDFVQNTVLKTDIDAVPCSLIQHDKYQIINRKFKYPVICHFVNSWLHHNTNSNFPRHFLGTGTQSSWESIVAACIRHNYNNMLEIFINIANFEPSFRTKILYLAACYATEATFEKLERFDPLLRISNPSLLHVAVEVGNFALVSYLLSSCGFRSAIESFSLQPINSLIPYCVANTINATPNIVENRVKILQLLLKCKGISLTLADKDDKIPISQPKVHVTLLCEMIQHMTSDELRNVKDENDRTILHIHANELKQNDYIKFLSCLKTYNPDGALSLIKYRDWFGQTPLHYFVSKTEPTSEILKFFKENGADFNCRDFTGYYIQWTLLQNCRNFEIFDTFLGLRDVKRQLNFLDNFMRPNLHIAARHIKNPNILYVLIKFGCDVNEEDCFGNTPLFYALRNPNHDVSKRCIEILYDNKADLHHQNQKGESLFHVAAQQGNVKAMELLFQLGYFGGETHRNRQVYSTSSLVDKNGNTPLHHALVCRKMTTISTVQFLVSRFLSDVNHLNKKDHCPLQHGLIRKRNIIKFEVIEYLERSISKWPQELIANTIQAVNFAKMSDTSVNDKYDELSQRILSKEKRWRKTWRNISGHRNLIASLTSLLLTVVIGFYLDKI